MSLDPLAAYTQLGAIGFLVVLLVFLLKQSNEERRETNDRYLTALTTTVTKHNEISEKVATSMTDLANSTREQTKATTEEHNALMDAIGKLGTREPSIEPKS